MKNLKLNFIRSSGFSIIEIMTASVILGAGIIGVAKFQSDIVQGSTSSKQQVEAVNIARAKLDELLMVRTASDFIALVSSAPGENSVQGNTSTYLLTWSVTELSHSRDAKVSLNVSWGDESVQLATILSNSTPAALTLTQQAPPRDPVADPEYVPITFPAVKATNPANSENICRCNGAVAVAFNATSDLVDPIANNFSSDGFMKVSGMRGSWDDSDGDGIKDDDDSYERPITGATAECDLCCASASAAVAVEQTDKYYAQLEEAFNAKMKTGDQVISLEDFVETNLFKTRHNTIQNDDFIKKASWSWSWSDYGNGDDIDDSDPATYTFTASCGIDYSASLAPTVAIPNPEPEPKSVRCIYYRNN